MGNLGWRRPQVVVLGFVAPTTCHLMSFCSEARLNTAMHVEQTHAEGGLTMRVPVSNLWGHRGPAAEGPRSQVDPDSTECCEACAIIVS
ncbi:hypothetical protein C8Q70DRAFT_307637 [Cubamyces menziesii]|nr:hypothetical protein C8Q70DRAFT_307637 [Cubamyces menziesii]